MMLWEEYNDDLCYGYNNCYLYYPKMWFEYMDQIDIDGTKYNIPTPVNDFLDLKFGLWRDPSAPTIEQRKTLTKNQYLELREKKMMWRGPKEENFLQHHILTDMDKYYSRTVYIAGCFDLFHHGHARILERAASLGYRLIVGVATDEYYESYKKKKPVLNYNQRSYIVSRIKNVDLVIPHDAKKSIDVYEKYGITTLVIGDDYSPTPSHKERIEEAKKRDIEIITLPTTKDINSSSIKKRIKDDWRYVFEKEE